VALVALIIILPLLGAALVPCLGAVPARQLGHWALLPPAGSFFLTLTLVPLVSRGESAVYALPWFPQLGVSFSLWIDGLSVLFALLISGIGLLITWYSRYYLGPAERVGRTA
jgi:multicomponent Na+:H+ antiporter subunit A